MLADAGALDSLVVTDAAEAAAIWRIREDGAGLAARTSDGRPAHAGWEDAAVPLERLGDYLREFEALLDQHGLQCVPYGHFGDGCVHGRIDFPFGTGQRRRPGAVPGLRRGRRPAGRRLRRLAVRRARRRPGAQRAAAAHVLPRRPSRCSSRSRRCSTRTTCSTPACSSGPRRLDDDDPDGRRPAASASGLALAYRHDGGDFSAAVHRCTGVGKCRADLQATGGVMCPSWPATREEKDTTRGRARVLQEMLAPGGPVRDWRSPEVHDALDLCLSCKGCSRDCPTGVDMATLQGRGAAPVLPPPAAPALALHARPAAALGRPRRPRAAAGQRRARLAAGRPAGEVVGAGMDQRRERAAVRRRAPSGSSGPAAADGHSPDDGPPVALWVDSFTDHFAPRGGLRGRAGAGGGRLPGPGARRRHLLRADLDHHRPARRARAILGAHGARRSRRWSDAGHPDRRRRAVVHRRAARRRRSSSSAARTAERVAAGTRTLAELLAATPGWEPPSLAGRGGRRAAALPPRRGARLVGRRRAAASGPARRSPGSAAAAAWPATGASSAGTTTCR